MREKFLLGRCNKIIDDNLDYVPLNAHISAKMPQSGVGSMQGKDTGNMLSAMCASSMNKSLDPTPI